MPSATSSKSSVGTKRKAESTKEPHVKKSKIKNTSKVSSKSDLPVRSVKAPKAKKEPVEEPDDSFDDLSDDGGVALENADEGGNEDMEDDAQELEGVHPDRVKAAFAAGAGPNGTSSREAHAKQKLEAAQRKAAKPLADQLVRTKKIWERLRIKSAVPKEERTKLVTELFEIITGKIKDFVLKHDSVRIVQTALKYSNPEQRRMIAKELQGTYRQLAESRYAKFLIGKLLVQGDDEIRDIIVPEFFGNVRRMIKHPEASWILDDIYRGIATRQQKATLLREWYGAEFVLFKKDDEKTTGDLSEILAEDPGKRAPIMRSLQELINHLIQKKMTGFTMLHDAMLQYFLNAKAGTEEITDYIELIKGDEEGDLLKNLAFTKSGSHVVCLALAYGTAKDRKHVLKTYKDTLQLMASDANGHIVILTAYEVIDDTVLTAKSIFPELLGKDATKQVENVVAAVNNLFARTVLLYLYQGRSKSLFPYSLSSDLEILTEVDTIRTTTSKKDPDIRRAELAKSISPMLLNAIASAPADLVSTSFGCQFVTEVLFGADGDKTAALQSIAETAGGDPTITEETVVANEDAINTHETPESHLVNSPSAGRMYKTLVAGGRFDPKLKKITAVSPPLNFADILFPVIEEHLIQWATGPSSFVVLSLLESEEFGQKEKVLTALRKEKKALQKASVEETAEQKAKAEKAKEEELELEKKGKPKSKKAKAKGERSVGNVGSKMLLALL